MTYILVLQRNLPNLSDSLTNIQSRSQWVTVFKQRSLTKNIQLKHTEFGARFLTVVPSRKSRACSRTGLDNVVLPIEIAKKCLRGHCNLFPVKDGERTIGGGGGRI